jgi:hypothetical protein
MRFLFFVPLMLHTLAAYVRPLLLLIGCGKDARVNGAPISCSNDMFCQAEFLESASDLRASLAEGSRR